MKNKYLIKLSLIFSLFLLFLLTSLFSFLYIISLKPIKINLLDYFDRKSEIYEKYDLREVGSVYVSFNRISKNFEILAEDVIVGKNHFKNILVGIDITFSENLFDTTLKVFDSRFELDLSDNYQLDSFNLSKTNKDEYLHFLNYFKNIEIVNSLLEINLGENKKTYLLDLIFRGGKDFKILVNETNDEVNNFLLVEKYKNSNLYKLKVKNFNFELLNKFLNNSNFYLDQLKVSGESSFYLENQSFSKNIKNINLTIQSKVSLDSNQDIQKIFINNAKFSGKNIGNKFEVGFKFEDRGIKFNFAIKLNSKPNEVSNFKLVIDKINTFQLLELWPKNFQMSVYNWMMLNSSGNISDLNFNLDFNFNDKLNFENLNGNFNFSDTEIKYMEDMPVVKKLHGFAKIYPTNIIFDIKGGESDNLNLEDGIVDLFDLNTNIEKAKIELNISGKNSEVLNYLDKSIIDKNTYSDLRNVNGDNFINLVLAFPLLIDLKVEQVDYVADIKITNGLFKDFFSDYTIKNFNLEIFVNNNKTEFKGEGELLNSKLNFLGNQKFINNEFINSINGNYILEAKSIPSKLFSIEFNDSGSIPIEFNIDLVEDSVFKFEGIGSLDNYSINSNFLGEKLITKGGRVRFIIRPFGNLRSVFFDLKTPNLLAEINANFDESYIKNIEISKLKSPNQDFKLKFDIDKSELVLYGEKLTLENRKLFENKRKIDKLLFKSDLRLIKINEQRFFDPSLSFNLNNGSFEKLNINLSADQVDHRVFIGDENGKQKFVLETNYLPEFLSILDQDLNVTRGSLKVEGIKNLSKNNYVGQIAGKDIVFSDAPFFANFFSLFSLQGLAQKIKDGGIIFDKLKARYELTDNKLRIVDSLLKGSELGIQFDSVIGLDNDYLMTNGSIIPAYTLNTLITKFPIVGDIITAGSPEDGLIGANFTIEKDNNGEIEVSYNPISVFVPNIIKNFLTD